MAQLICRYRKGEEVRWISHLDVKRTLERAMRRARLPLCLTQGHNPHPKLSLGPPLPLGATGEAELLALHLDTAMDPSQVKDALNSHLPSGLEVVEVWAVPGYRKRETFGEIDVAEYQVVVRGGPPSDVVSLRAAELMAREEQLVKRGGARPERTVDLRPMILSLQVRPSEEGATELQLRLRTGSHGGARPQEIAELLGLGEGDCVVSYHRLALYASARPGAGKPPGLRRRWSRPRGSRERS